ncbi:copal-8-ol diphosphate hydratase chloroplastic-like isoform X3 [Tripterygium wilfordii]|uniref:Copal-8-ol diphosphate hydratase chloroplastic-like isoform X3 n=1 Tax=Tripterygium wilfordii TaxID=458696 RepID=A0A7J7DYW7_TRIWF|nr:copal-8-ol diphosphate hydratase chloroplastic-like isoform X3 [Tripterygium wilfordii]
MVEDGKLEMMEDEIKEHAKGVKSFLGSMEDGEMSISAYDTAWVALIEDKNQIGTPQFPSCLQWIIQNQLTDGSWGDPRYFLSCDRILNTLACVISLKAWNIHPDKARRGISFLNEKMSMLEKENEEHFLGGFEIVFPSILEMARKLEIQLPDDDTCSALQDNIKFKRNLKLTRISKEGIQNVATTVLFSLEGLQDMELDWEKILKMQSKDGSFLSSPSSTAYAFLQTKDQNCFIYLNKVIQRFNGADVFRHSKEGEEFICYSGQWNEGISVMLFPGERILEDAKKFSSKLLRGKREANRFLDKWILTKDLAGEIGLALDVPWYGCLPRVQARFYVDQYGAGDVVHIGKTLFR